MVQQTLNENVMIVKVTNVLNIFLQLAVLGISALMHCFLLAEEYP